MCTSMSMMRSNSNSNSNNNNNNRRIKILAVVLRWQRKYRLTEMEPQSMMIKTMNTKTTRCDKTHPLALTVARRFSSDRHYMNQDRRAAIVRHGLDTDPDTTTTHSSP